MVKDYRRCVSCRKLAPRNEFWRVVRSYPSHTITIELGNTLQGRSAYLCPTTVCLQIAQKKNRLGRSLKAKVDEGIYQQLGSLKQLTVDSDSPHVGFPTRLCDPPS